MIQQILKTDFKCKEKPTEIKGKFKENPKVRKDKCELNSYLVTGITTKFEFRALNLNYDT